MYEYLNDIAEVAYVSDPETYELIYLNDHGKRLLGVDSVEGCLCYELLQGAEKPCPFCTNDRLTCERSIVWEHHNPVTNRRYLLKDRRLVEDGKPLRIEIALDMAMLGDGGTASANGYDVQAYARESALLREYNMLMSTLRVAVSKHRFDEDFGVQWANDYFFELSGYSRDEFAERFGDRCRSYFADEPDEFAKLRDTIVGAYEAGEPGFECLVHLPRNGGERTWIQVAGRFIDEEAPDGKPLIYVTFTCVDEAVERDRARSDELRRLAYVDPVTGGRNRASFEEDAGRALRAAPPETYALVTLDVDGFKIINDQYGLEQGDEVLRVLHRSFEDALGPDEFAARIAADQFSLLLKTVDRERLEARIEAMVSEANRCLAFDAGQVYVVTMTTGAYVVDDPHLPMVTVQDRANLARKKTTRAGSGRWCSCGFYSNEDRVRLAQEKDVENRMRAALAAGEFVMYLQPKLDLRRNEVAGAEALVRWNDSRYGLVSPSSFIPIFERTGFVVDVDLHMFEQACALQAAWRAAGVRPVPVSVNLSRLHLLDDRFLDRFEGIRRRYGVPAKLLEFELTETLVFEDPERLAHVIDLIHDAGYGCSMDDFGSGYSSLNMLKDLAVDTLKLDRVFFDASALGDARATDIIDIVVQMARRLGMKTVAEGVETEAQRAFLAGVGCDMMQGFLFCRPVDVPTFERLAFGVEISAPGEPDAPEGLR